MLSELLSEFNIIKMLDNLFEYMDSIQLRYLNNYYFKFIFVHYTLSLNTDYYNTTL